MFCSRMSTVIVSTCIFLLVNGIAGQHKGDSIKICELCRTDNLLDCNLTDMMHIYMTVNCEVADKVCTLGIDQSFENFDNLTMDNINQEQICVFKDGSEVIPNIVEHSISFIAETTKGYEELLKTSTEGTFVERTSTQGSLDYQDDVPVEIVRTFRSGPVPDVPENLSPPLKEKVNCFMCKSSSDKSCLNMVDKLKPVECSNGCLTFNSGGDLIRDCASPLDVKLCQKPDNISCEWCPDNECNKMPRNECYQCNSKDNPNCALWSNVENMCTTICPNSNDKCLTRITTDGDTIRDCAHVDFNCTQGEQCSPCVKPLCNVGVFPADRLRCIQCQECENEQDPSTALPCVRYDAHEECFLYVTAKSKMIRGCVSNATEMEQCRTNEPKCISCGNKNGCNSVPLMKKPNLSCSKCKSRDNPGCAWAQPPNAVTKCQNKVLYYLQETCMTEFDPVTLVAVRDCSFDNGVCTPEDHNCQTCSGNGCNRGNLKVQQCIQCNSEVLDQTKCGYRAEGIPPTKCPQETQMFDSKGCFVMTKGNFTIRGCKASLAEDDLKFCKKEGKVRCELCEGDGCNDQLGPSSGWRTMPIYFIAIVCSVFVIL